MFSGAWDQNQCIKEFEKRRGRCEKVLGYFDLNGGTPVNDYSQVAGQFRCLALGDTKEQVHEKLRYLIKSGQIDINEGCYDGYFITSIAGSKASVELEFVYNFLDRIRISIEFGYDVFLLDFLKHVVCPYLEERYGQPEVCNSGLFGPTYIWKTGKFEVESWCSHSFDLPQVLIYFSVCNYPDSIVVRARDAYWDASRKQFRHDFGGQILCDKSSIELL